ncbi:MAG: PilN domain-containing protein [Myxococcota bacterium]
MIRINLLPVREARRQAGLRNQGILLGVAAGIGVLACIGLQLSVSTRTAQHRRLITERNAELASLEQTRKQVERFVKERKQIEQKLDVIAQLERARTGPVRLMDEIASRIPERLWLEKMTAKGGLIAMKGLSLDAEIVAAFLTRLEESPMLSRVELLETKLEEVDGLKLNAFKINAQYPQVRPVVTEELAPTSGSYTGRRR